MRLRPEPFLPHAPAIDDVTDEIKLFGRMRFQEGAQRIGLAPGTAEMHIGDENRLVIRLRLTARGGHPLADSLISYSFCDSSGANM
jgi:hypothetical protein